MFFDVFLQHKLAFVSIAGAAAIALAWFGLRRLEQTSLYYPDREMNGVPTDNGFPFENLTLITDDNKQINAWYIPARPSDIPFARPFTLLLSHGNAGNISDRMEKAGMLSRLGLNVLLYDYRGYGRSEGVPSETGTYRDGSAAYRYLIDTRGIAAKDIFFYGESLGTAIATELALRFEGAGLILESPFTSVVEMTQLLYPWIPAELVVK